MTDLVEKTPVNKTKTTSEGSLLGKPMNTGSQIAQPDTASFNKQTMADMPENMPKAKLEVRDLNFYYGDFKALKNINIDIPERKVTAFIGPSGCGKSTLLRLSLIHI